VCKQLGDHSDEHSDEHVGEHLGDYLDEQLGEKLLLVVCGVLAASWRLTAIE